MGSKSLYIRARALILAACLLGGCQDDDAPLRGMSQGETGRVVRIIDGDALVLHTGLTVRLSGIEAPAPERRNRIGEPYADRSARLLEDLALGRTVRLIYPGLTRDRYDRALAYVETADDLGPKLWLNLEMLKRGAARARLYPDTSPGGEYLLAAEADARSANQGLWALAPYQVLPAEEIAEDARGFMIVTATLGAKHAPQSDRSVCRRSLLGAGLSLEIQAGADAFCRADAPRKPARFRGYVRDGQMEITHWMNVEPL